MKTMKFDNDQRRRSLLLKYTFFVLLAYAITQGATVLALLLGLSSVTYADIVGVSALTFGASMVFVLLIRLQKTVTTRFTAFVFFGQFAVWLVMYTVWLLVLRETRVMALFFALMALAFWSAQIPMGVY